MLDTDGVDNDADMDADGADGDGEGTITDNTLLNGVPAQVIASYTHSADLLKIEANETLYIYYRVDPHDDVAPLERLTSSVTATFDSLEGPFGNQSTPQQDNGLAGGARQYTSAAAEATIQIIPVENSSGISICQFFEWKECGPRCSSSSCK